MLLAWTGCDSKFLLVLLGGRGGGCLLMLVCGLNNILPEKPLDGLKLLSICNDGVCGSPLEVGDSSPPGGSP